MKEVTPEQWIEELESGRHHPGKGAFYEKVCHDDDRGGDPFTSECCLAVLASMCHPEKFEGSTKDGSWRTTEEFSTDGYWLTHEGSGSPLSMPEWLDDVNGYAAANDNGGLVGYPIEYIKATTGVHAD
jgi:hypothetical protein